MTKWITIPLAAGVCSLGACESHVHIDDFAETFVGDSWDHLDSYGISETGNLLVTAWCECDQAQVQDIIDARDGEFTFEVEETSSDAGIDLLFGENVGAAVIDEGYREPGKDLVVKETGVGRGTVTVAYSGIEEYEYTLALHLAGLSVTLDDGSIIDVGELTWSGWYFENAEGMDVRALRQRY